MQNQFVVDSLKIRIPLSEVEIINPSIEGKWLLLNDITGEIIPSHFKKQAYSINDNGIHIYFAKEKFLVSKGNQVEFLVMLITSKLLKERYLEGITFDNIRIIYELLISYKVVKFSYDSFISGDVTDVDFKKDKQGTNVSKYIRYCSHITKEKSLVRKYERKENKGIQWSVRDTTKLSEPFWKIYDKGINLKYKEVKFYEEYLKDTESDNTLDNLMRIEYTIKNKKHFRKYDIESTSLKDILNLSNKLKEAMFQDTVSKHLDIFDIKQTQIREGLMPNQVIELTAMDIIIQGKLYGSEKLIDLLTKGIENKSQRSKKKKELKELYRDNLKVNLRKVEKEAKIRDNVRELLFS